MIYHGLQNIASWPINNDYHQGISLRSLKDFFWTPKTNFVTNSLVKKNFYSQVDILNF